MKSLMKLLIKVQMRLQMRLQTPLRPGADGAAGLRKAPCSDAAIAGQYIVAPASVMAAAPGPASACINTVTTLG